LPLLQNLPCNPTDKIQECLKKQDIGDKMAYEGNYLKPIHISIINENRLQNKYDIEDPKGKTCTSKYVHKLMSFTQTKMTNT
jgi:hypothetical protein